MKCLMCNTGAVFSTDENHKTCACGGMVDNDNIEPGMTRSLGMKVIKNEYIYDAKFLELSIQSPPVRIDPAKQQEKYEEARGDLPL